MVPPSPPIPVLEVPLPAVFRPPFRGSASPLWPLTTAPSGQKWDTGRGLRGEKWDTPSLTGRKWDTCGA